MHDGKPVIMQVLPELDHGGIEEVVVELSGEIAKAGYGSLVASAGGRRVSQVEKAGVKHITMPLASKNPFTMRRNMLALAGVIRAAGVDIVHAHSRAPAWSAYYAAKRTGAHFVTSVHSYYGVKGFLGLKKRYNYIMAHGERVLAVSSFMKEHVISVYGKYRENVRRLYVGVDTEKFSPAKVMLAKKAELVGQWRLPENARIVLMPGRGSPTKGLSYIIEALAKMKHDDVYVVLAGAQDDGNQKYLQELSARAQELGVVSRVRFTRPCPDMPAAYALAEVVASTSVTPESFGRTIVEAQAMERIPVSFDQGGPMETIRNGQTGFLVPLGDTQALAETIDKVMDMTPEEYRSIAQAAAETARREFSLTVMAKKTLDIYKDIFTLSPSSKKRRAAFSLV